MKSDDAPHPPWWTRQYLDSFVLSEEEAWRIIDGPPWKCVIGWVTRECEPVVCEMAYAVVNGMIMLTSTRNRDKVKALRRNPAISICFQGTGLKQVTIRGRVEFCEDPQMVRRWAEATVANALKPLPKAQQEKEIQRYLSPDRLVLIVHVEKMRTFNGEKMFRAERAGE
jgi:nitroimidazol reductase NimA-like FMN-containing flavoprotein (pyridoxamine 5'-phosphate oxidase superfamily)